MLLAFFRAPIARGLAGAVLIISDASEPTS